MAEQDIDLAALLGGGGAADTRLVDGILQSSAKFSGDSLRAMLFIANYHPELAVLIENHAARWHNSKLLLNALEKISIYDKLQGFNIMGGGGGGK